MWNGAPFCKNTMLEAKEKKSPIGHATFSHANRGEETPHLDALKWKANVK